MRARRACSRGDLDRRAIRRVHGLACKAHHFLDLRFVRREEGLMPGRRFAIVVQDVLRGRSRRPAGVERCAARPVHAVAAVDLAHREQVAGSRFPTRRWPRAAVVVLRADGD